MTSRIAWLDASAEEQRRVREIVQLFSQKETQDELGGRRIVVALSDAMFPGTSVLHRRARYLVFIPWLCMEASRYKDKTGWLDWLERQLIASFLEDPSVKPEDRLEGLIGREAGTKVKQLPSSAYWTALEAWGIKQIPGTIEETLERTAVLDDLPSEEEELATRRLGVWHPGLRPMPDGFPRDQIAGGFRMTEGEATWLLERWIDTADGSLLTHLARGPRLSDAWAPWIEPACASASSEMRDVLENAERFSLAIDGARLLYRLMVAEQFKSRGFEHQTVDKGACRERLAAWAEDAVASRSLFDGWSSDEFWTFLRRSNRRAADSRPFFDPWFDVIQSGRAEDAADDTDLREEVLSRERQLKKHQARLVNDKMLSRWRDGDPGRVTFRWEQVRQLVDDVHDGLGR